MSPDRRSPRLGDIIDRLDMVAGWLGDTLDGDAMACAEVTLAAADLADLKLEIERAAFWRVAV